MPSPTLAVHDRPITLARHPGPLGILRLVREPSGTFSITLAGPTEARVLAESDSLIPAEALFRREVARHG